MHARIKICCISSIEEARLAISAGADALGLVGKMPSGPGPIEDELIASIAITIPPPIASFLLTSEQSAEGIVAHLKKVHTNTVQIVDEVSAGTYRLIRKELPTIRIVQVVHVADEDSFQEAIRVSEYVDAILLDSGNPKAAIKTLGGTGQTHNWDISRKIVESCPVPVFLAGGLNASNVKEAIRLVKPFAVDVCSGVRTNGKLDPRKLDSFISAVITDNG
jgi:phosphoribosylanthranilate isomerase